MIDLEEQLQRHLGSVAERAQPIPDLDAAFGDELQLRRTTSTTSRRSWLPAAAAIVAVVAGVVGIVAMTDLRSPSTADEPNTTPLPISTIESPISTTELPIGSVDVPGMTSVQTSRSSQESSAFAQRLQVLLAAEYPQLELREDAIRTTDSGRELAWVYFLDGQRRLFVASGPSDLLDGKGLRPTTDGFAWPDETGAVTIATRQPDSTVIVRSESIEANGQPRTAADVHHIAEIVATEVRPETG